VRQRDTWEAAAARGNPDALAKLSAPFPDCLEYLWRWANELHGRSGYGQYGVQPLSYGTLADWARLTDRHPTPAEVSALIALDAAMSAPAEKPKSTEAKPLTTPSWPTRKANG
jgi:hypothetical protein